MRLAPKIRSYVVNRLPEDGTSLPKNVGVGTEHEVCFMMFYYILISVLCCFKYWNVRKYTA